MRELQAALKKSLEVLDERSGTPAVLSRMGRLFLSLNRQLDRLDFRGGSVYLITGRHGKQPLELTKREVAELDALMEKKTEVVPIMRMKDNEELEILKIMHEQAWDANERDAIMEAYSVRAAEKSANLLEDTLNHKLDASILGAANVVNAEKYAPQKSKSLYLLPEEELAEIKEFVSQLNIRNEDKIRAHFKRFT